MNQLVWPIGLVLLLVLFSAGAAAVGLQMWSLTDVARRLIFVIGVGLAPIGVIAALALHAMSEQIGFFVAMYAILAQTIGFIALARRSPQGEAHEHRRRLRTDTVWYLVSSVLWFTLIYWTGSSATIEGLQFAVATTT